MLVPVNWLSNTATALPFYEDLVTAVQQDNFHETFIKCKTNEFMEITYMAVFNPSGSYDIVRAYGMGREIKDIYKLTGTFVPGEYRGYE